MSAETEYREALTRIRTLLESIVCTEGVDSGVVMLSQEGPTHWDAEFQCNIYEHEYFSPLGDALMELYQMTDIVK